MQRHAAFAILCLVAFVILGGCVGRMEKPAGDNAAIVAAIDSLDRAANAANAAKDTAAMVAMYADDAMLLPAGMPQAVGKEAIHKIWVATYRTPGLQLSITPGHKTIAQAGDMVVESGTYDFKALGPKNERLHDVGKYVTVYRRDKAGWKVFADTWNSDLPAPGSPK